MKNTVEKNYYYAFVVFEEPCRSGGYFSYIYKFKEFAIVCGNWAYLANGKRKNINGEHIEIWQTSKIKPRKMSKEDQKAILTSMKKRKAI